MKSQFRMVFVFVVVLMAVSLACGASQPSVVPTNPPPPTSAPLPTSASIVQPTQEQSPQPSQNEQFFTEEFDQDPGSGWVVDIIGPGAEAHKDSVKTEFSNSKMRVELPENQIYFYYTYTLSTYENVRIDLRADNRGVNTNNVSLFCRSSSDGWYEWGIGNGGDWYLYAFTDEYNLITSGGTLFLKQGKEVNEYTMICQDKKISMFINGQEIKQSPVIDNKYGLRDGTVGFNISSLDVTPVIIEVDWFKISQP